LLLLLLLLLKQKKKNETKDGRVGASAINVESKSIILDFMAIRLDFETMPTSFFFHFLLLPSLAFVLSFFFLNFRSRNQIKNKLKIEEQEEKHLF